MKIVLFAFVLIGVLLVNLAIRRNLQHRERARTFRGLFVETSSELLRTGELPPLHAKLLIDVARLPLGLATFIIVLKTFYQAIAAKRPHDSNAVKEMDREPVPDHLKEQYVIAMMSFVIADSYFSVFAGSIFRAMNSWIFDAVREAKCDVTAHATQHMVKSVTVAKSQAQRLPWMHGEIACA